MPLRIGETFAEYRVLRLLGSGGMGEVYLVQHPRLPRQEALKVLRPDLSSDDSFRERFIREADLASGLRHPHIVGVHDRGDYEGQLWIAMDYIDGSDVGHLLEQKYPAGMPTDLVARITTAVASALDYAHKKALLHRDVKPANIIVADLDTDDPSIYLADFGIARPLDDTSGITATNMTVGTVAYAAPEQLMGEPMDGRSDQYALAATTYNLLTGSQLFPNSNPAVVISRHLNTTPPRLGDCRPDCARLDDVLRKALAKDPATRFPSCSAFAQVLADESTGQGAASANATTQAAGQPRSSASTMMARPPKPLSTMMPRPTKPPAKKAAPPKPPAKKAAGPTKPPSGRSPLVLVVLVVLGGITAVILGALAAMATDRIPSTPTTTAAAPLPTTPFTPMAPPPPPPPVSIETVPPPTNVVSGPTIGDDCSDWGKFDTDPVSGQDMLCNGYSSNIADGASPQWYSAEEGAVGPATGLADLPRVGRKGNSCRGEVSQAQGRSSDDYFVWCIGGGQYDPPGSQPIWTVFRP